MDHSFAHLRIGGTGNGGRPRPPAKVQPAATEAELEEIRRMQDEARHRQAVRGEFCSRSPFCSPEKSGLIVFLLRCDVPRPQGSICGYSSAHCAPTPSRSFQPSYAKRNSSKRLSIRPSSCTDPPFPHRCLYVDQTRGTASCKGAGLSRHLALNKSLSTHTPTFAR